jgi:hypothetical protein
LCGRGVEEAIDNQVRCATAIFATSRPELARAVVITTRSIPAMLDGTSILEDTVRPPNPSRCSEGIIDMLEL